MQCTINYVVLKPYSIELTYLHTLFYFIHIPIGITYIKYRNGTKGCKLVNINNKNNRSFNIVDFLKGIMSKIIM